MRKEHLILVPVFNEAENIMGVIQGLLDLNLESDILIVNDGSTDTTFEIVKSLPVKVVSHCTNLGYAAALQTGFKYAFTEGYKCVIQFDGDGQHCPKDIMKLLFALRDKKIDFVIGSRFLNNEMYQLGLSKKIAISLFRGLIRLTTKKKITDPTSGFRGYKRHVFKTFTDPFGFPSDFPDSNFIIELLLKRYRVGEVPVSMKLRTYGESMHSGLKPLIYMVQISLSILIVWLRFVYKGGVEAK